MTGHYITASAPVDTALAQRAGFRSSTTERNPAASALRGRVVLHRAPACGGLVEWEGLMTSTQSRPVPGLVAVDPGRPRKRISRSWTLPLKRIGTIPVKSSATIGRGVMLAAAVVRYSVTDAITLRLPLGECRPGVDAIQGHGLTGPPDGNSIRWNDRGAVFRFDQPGRGQLTCRGRERGRCCPSGRPANRGITHGRCCGGRNRIRPRRSGRYARN